MIPQTLYRIPLSLLFLTVFFVLLSLFTALPTRVYAQAHPDGGGQSAPLYVDRTDDDATAQACTDAPNDCTLRGAIIRANQQVSTTTIFLTPAKTYELTIPPDAVNDATTGDLNITANVNLHGIEDWITCIIQDCFRPKIQAGTLGLGWVDRVLRLENGATVTLNYLEINGGGYLDLAHGGGILVTGQAHLTLIDSYLQNNLARSGGGMALVQGTALLQDTQFVNNYATQTGGGLWLDASTTLTMTGGEFANNLALYGGGITNFGHLTLSDSDLYGNIATDENSGIGGALYNQGHATLRQTKLFQNIAKKGGGAIANENELVLEGAKLYKNSATVGDGGALLTQPLTATTLIEGSYLFENKTEQGNGGGIWNAGDITLLNSTVAENFAASNSSNGGGIFHNSGNLTMVNSTVSSNLTAGKVGGLYVTATGTGALTHVTIAKNMGAVTGGLLSLNPSLRISNTFIAQNYIPITYNDCSGSFTSQGYNLIGKASGCTRLGPATADIVETTTTPLSDLQNNGGATATHALLPGNPAINNGSPDSCLPLDQRGAARPLGGRCDIGAYEAALYYIPLVAR